jgi:predicted nucleic acid-binding protein
VTVICYFDTSFMAKLYLPEAESGEAVALAAGLAGDVAISTLVDVEMASLLFRQLKPERARGVYAIYLRNRRAGVYKVLRIDDAVMVRARELAAAGLRLKSLDTIQLATALHYGANAMAVYDGELRTTASGMGLRVFPERS